MKPDDQTNTTSHTPLSSRDVGDLRAQNYSRDQDNRGQVSSERSYLQETPERSVETSQHAAAGLIRGQIDQIYDSSARSDNDRSTPVNARQSSSDNRTDSLRTQTKTVEPPHESLHSGAGQKKDSNPYERTMASKESSHSQLSHQQSEQWQKYHSAWQEYYQKYYEQYYVAQLVHAKPASVVEAKESKRPEASRQSSISSATLSKDEAVNTLRGQIRTTISKSASRARASRHFIPAISSLAVVIVFIFLQYNQVFGGYFVAYAAPSSQIASNTIIDPTPNIAVDAAPKIIIPKINVDASVDYTSTPDYDSQMAAMKNGVAYFGIPGANSKPGQVGNTVLSGHSSNDLFDNGTSKFIFVALEKLEKNDTIYINYESKRYVYSVTKKEVVKPTDVQALIYPTDKPILTLITCTPIGTSLNRLLVTAEQISPDPSAADEAPKTPESVQNSFDQSSIPGNTPSFLQRLFGVNSRQ